MASSMIVRATANAQLSNIPGKDEGVNETRPRKCLEQDPAKMSGGGVQLRQPSKNVLFGTPIESNTAVRVDLMHFWRFCSNAC